MDADKPRWPRWLRRLLIALAIVVVLAAPAYYWFLIEDSPPSSGHYSIDIAEVRRLASSRPGSKPLAIHVEQVNLFRAPHIIVMAGAPWAKVDLPVFSYQLVYPDRTAIIDTAMDEKLAKDAGADATDSAAYQRVSRAISQAALILLTHEHPDHIGGLTVQPDLARVLGNTRLTQEQVDHPERMKPAAFPTGALDHYEPLHYDQLFAISPGVVLIKSPGHSPGSQMIYVQKADGTEVLFLGDVAWQWPNVEQIRERSRLATRFFLEEDRTAVFLELAELNRLNKAEPRLHMVPGHDGRVIAALTQQQILKAGFN